MAGSAVLVVPGSLETRTGGYIYDRHVVEGLRARGWSVDVIALDESFPRPSAAARAAAASAFDALTDGAIVLIDSLALGVIPEILERHATRLRLVALVHLPLAADVGLDPAEASRLALTEARALKAVRLVVVTGRAALPLLAGYDIPESRVTVIEPGTDRAARARGSSGSPVRLLCVATLNPGKGHLDLLTALAAVPSRHWLLTCAGSLTRHPLTTARVKDTLHRLGLGERVCLAGDLEPGRLEKQYDQSDVFVLATLRETYGMAVAEALARGLPVVSTIAGAIPELVGGDAGLLVSPGDTAALTEALARVIGDPVLRSRLAAGARRAGEGLPGWDECVRRLAAALESVCDD